MPLNPRQFRLSLSTRSFRHKQRQKFRDAPDSSPWNPHPGGLPGQHIIDVSDVLDFDTALRILEAAAKFWSEKMGIPFHVLVSDAQTAGTPLPGFSAPGTF